MNNKARAYTSFDIASQHCNIGVIILALETFTTLIGCAHLKLMGKLISQGKHYLINPDEMLLLSTKEVSWLKNI